MVTKAAKKAATLMSDAEAEQRDIAVASLDFDERNPRFPTDVASGPVEELLRRFVRDERLLEIIESIGQQGYFRGEPLLVVANGKRYTVVEGNRRLAALKLLSGELEVPEGRISIENAVEDAKFAPDQAPCLVFNNEKAILKYLGFRHITGIKAWSALQKARYMKRLMSENYEGTSYDEALRYLAKDTGSKAPYLGQMLTALELYERTEKKNFYNYKVDAEEIDFSILSTSLSYKGIVDYLGLSSRTDSSVQGLARENLKDLFFFLFVKGPNQKSIVGESRNLKKLAAIVASPIAVKHLKKEGRLSEAYELSKGPAEALLEALIQADRRLTVGRDIASKITKGITKEHASMIDEIRDKAESLKSLIDSTVAVARKKAGTRHGS